MYSRYCTLSSVILAAESLQMGPSIGLRCCLKVIALGDSTRNGMRDEGQVTVPQTGKQDYVPFYPETDRQQRS